MSKGATQHAEARFVLVGGTVRRHPPRRGDVPVVIGEAPVTIGRDEQCTLVLRDPKVSAVHAELVATPQGVRIRDLGSKNGTYIGGVRVGDNYLARDCTIECGDSQVMFEPSKPEATSVTVTEAFGPLVGRAQPMLELFDRLRRAAPKDISVMILGETGTGKELVAQAIHQASPRAKGPFVVLDCSAIAPTLAEAVLFGHARGAFTGAVSDKTSPFIEAHGGTLFLDELGELPQEIQPKLLRALGERRVKAVGGRDYKSFDVRLVAATRRDLIKEVNTDAFRSDLYFRIAQLRVELPALRERISDVPLLIRHLIGVAGGDPATMRVRPEQMERLLRYEWPGNVRELKNAVWTALSLAEGSELDIVSHLFMAPPGAQPLSSHVPYHEAKARALEQFTCDYFTRLAARTGGKITEMARLAGLERAHVRKYLRAHGLERAARRGKSTKGSDDGNDEREDP
jgi:DNA-binding NtrC family response regulator